MVSRICLSKNPPVRYHDHRIDHRVSILFQPDQLMGQPGNGIGFAGPGAVLDQIPFAHPMGLYIRQELFHTVQLMIPGPDLLDGLFPGVRVFLRHHLGIIFNDPGQFFPGQDVLPQVIGHYALRVGRIPGPILVPFVEGQEPAVFPLEFRAEHNGLVVQGKMHHTALERKEQVPGIPVFLVLCHRISRILPGKVVLQFQGDHRQPVDEQAQIQGQLPPIHGIPQLPGNAENVLFEPLPGFFVLFRRGEIEQDQVCRIGLDAIAQHIDDSPPGNFPGKPVQELPLLLVALVDPQFFHFFGLGIVQKPEKTGFVNGIFFVVILVGPLLIAIPFHQPVHNEGFKALFRFIRKSHGQSSSPRIPAFSSLPSPASSPMSSTCS